MNCPPDTDTPGFETENQTKPEETHLISETAGLFQPDQVARFVSYYLLSNGIKLLKQ